MWVFAAATSALAPVGAVSLTSAPALSRSLAESMSPWRAANSSGVNLPRFHLTPWSYWEAWVLAACISRGRALDRAATSAPCSSNVATTA